jgi:hypothetical protein
MRHDYVLKVPTILRQALKQIVFGGDTLPMRFFIGQPQLQEEIAVWLHDCSVHVLDRIRPD